MTRFTRALIGFMVGLLLVLGLAHCADAADLEPRQSGWWYDPAYDGQGVNLSVYESAGVRRVFLATYLGGESWQSRPMWFTGSGLASAGVYDLIQSREFFGLPSQGAGGVVAGSILLTVEACNRIRADISVDTVTAVTFHLVPLLPNVGAGC